MKRLKGLLPGAAILIVAAAVRLPALTAGLPYATYVDEGHVLHHVVHLLAERTWEPDTYSYPSLPFYLIAGAALAYAPLYAVLHDRPLRDALSPVPYRYYDIVEPVDLIVLGRLITLVFSLGVVILTGLLARRLAGPAAGLFAAWIAALVPALVVRSAIVNINPIVTFFVLAALFFADRARDGDRPRWDAALAGAMAGLAAATKYPAALVCLPIGLAVLLAGGPWKERLVRLLLSGGTAIATFVLAMPAFVLRTRQVLEGLQIMSQIYSTQEIGSYWGQAVGRAEWDLPLEHPEMGIALLAIAAAGLFIALRDSRWLPPVLGWLLFSVATGHLVTAYKFRAFRNLLLLVPLACVVAALVYARPRRSVRRPLWLDLAAIVLPVLLFAPALHSYVGYQVRLEDSREQAIRWLEARAGPRHKVLVADELAILPSRTAGLEAGEVHVKPWPQAKDRILQRRYHFVVLGDLTRPEGGLKIRPRVWRRINRNYTAVARFGHYPSQWNTGAFNGNGQVVYVLQRVPRQKTAEG
jgi:hypothetical protein